MSQPATHPHHMSNLLEPALIEIVHAVCDRPNQTMADYEAKADATWALLESFRPRDAIDLLLSGQLVAFNAVFADATLRLLGGMDDTLKKQTLSSLVSMGRVTQGHVDRLAKRGNQPYRTEIEAARRGGGPAEVGGHGADGGRTAGCRAARRRGARRHPPRRRARRRRAPRRRAAGRRHRGAVRRGDRRATIRCRNAFRAAAAR